MNRQNRPVCVRVFIFFFLVDYFLHKREIFCFWGLSIMHIKGALAHTMLTI